MRALFCERCPTWRWIRPATPLIAQFAEGILDCCRQFLGSAIDGLIHDRCLVRDSNWLESFEACFHQAAFIIAAFLLGIFIADVDFDTSDLLGEVA